MNFKQILKFIFLCLLLFEYITIQATEKYVIGFSQCTTADVWRETMQREMQIELAFYPDLEMIMKDANSDNKKQIQDIEEFLEQGIDLLIVSPNESEPLTPIIEKVFNSGIPVIVVDRNITSDAYTAFVGGNNYQIGKEAGIYAAKLLKGKGKIVEITGLTGSTPSIDRQKGFMESLNHYPDISIVS